MWYEKLGAISIGAQCGGPAEDGLSTIKVDLWKLFLKHCKNTRCASVNHFAVALRIGGEFHDYLVEAIEAIRRNNRDRTIGVDIVVPRSAWEGKSLNELRDYLAIQVRTALSSCIKRLQKDKEISDTTALLAEIEKALSEFAQLDYGTNPGS